MPVNGNRRKRFTAVFVVFFHKFTKDAPAAFWHGGHKISLCLGRPLGYNGGENRTIRHRVGPMQELILLKLGEVVLKGLIRHTFEDKPLANIRRRL